MVDLSSNLHPDKRAFLQARRETRKAERKAELDLASEKQSGRELREKGAKGREKKR